MEGRCNSSSSLSSASSFGSCSALRAASPKSPPPPGLDLYGKRRQMVKLQVLEREIGLLQVIFLLVWTFSFFLSNLCYVCLCFCLLFSFMEFGAPNFTAIFYPIKKIEVNPYVTQWFTWAEFSFVLWIILVCSSKNNCPINSKILDFLRFFSWFFLPRMKLEPKQCIMHGHCECQFFFSQ